jgi:hypothetical protein
MERNIAPETILYKISQDIVHKAQRNQTQKARKRKVNLEMKEDKIQKLRMTQENASREHKEEMIKIIDHRQELHTNRSLLIERIEERYKSQLINK